MTLISLVNLNANVLLPDGNHLTTVDCVNLDIEEGHSYSIMGRSGSGKTSLISIIGMLNMRFDGQYLYHGQDVRRMSDRERAKLRAEKIGFVFQNYSLIAHMHVWENVALPLMYSKKCHAESYVCVRSRHLMKWVSRTVPMTIPRVFRVENNSVLPLLGP
ncbi:ATP-binding cassette domain-containing protein [Arcanobacterium canis]